MLLITGLTSQARQKQTLALPDGTQFQIEIEYKPLQLGWFITTLTYGDFTLNGARIVTSPNILHQFKNKIPFGLACFTTDNQEPTLQEDFLEGRAQLFLLSESETQDFEDYLRGKTTA